MYLKYVKKMIGIYQVYVFDPANAGKAISDLNNLGYPVYEIWQSHKQLNEATQGF